MDLKRIGVSTTMMQGGGRRIAWKSGTLGLFIVRDNGLSLRFRCDPTGWDDDWQADASEMYRHDPGCIGACPVVAVENGLILTGPTESGTELREALPSGSGLIDVEGAAEEVMRVLFPARDDASKPVDPHEPDPKADPQGFFSHHMQRARAMAGQMREALRDARFSGAIHPDAIERCRVGLSMIEGGVTQMLHGLASGSANPFTGPHPDDVPSAGTWGEEQYDPPPRMRELWPTSSPSYEEIIEAFNDGLIDDHELDVFVGILSRARIVEWSRSRESRPLSPPLPPAAPGDGEHSDSGSGE